jgi:hypothetical protein
MVVQVSQWGLHTLLPSTECLFTARNKGFGALATVHKPLFVLLIKTQIVPEVW